MNDSASRPIDGIPSDVQPAATAPVARRRVSLPGRRRLASPRHRLGAGLGGVTAVAVKELRGRMRGRRAFVILTVYLMLLGGFGWMVELILERQKTAAFAGSGALASAQIGQGIFMALLMLETLLVIALAPAFTAGAISLEREKQTLDMLATTPVSSLSIVVGKLFSALTYLFILVFASIPLTAIVFVFGGVSPDDVVRGYAVLLSTAVGLCSVGLFWSALMRRTQAATIATYFAMLAVTLGSFFIFYFWNTMTGGGTTTVGPIKGRPPEALVYLNPYFAQADVMCGVESGFGDWCSQVAYVSERPVFGGIIPRPEPVPQAIPGKGFLPPDQGFQLPDQIQPAIQGFGVARDSFWPKSAIAWVVISVILIVASVQLVTPTRRWRLPRPRIPAALGRSRS
jgi:ABC-type transport system involved in multi-copper enzyme maturation permease subunit